MSALAAAAFAAARHRTGGDPFAAVVEVVEGVAADSRFCAACRAHTCRDTETWCPVCLDIWKRGR